MSDDDYDEFASDLTDLDDDDEVPLSLAQTGKKSSNEYKIRGALNAPRATSYPTQALHEMLEQGDIDLEADYQRGIVWPPNKQIGLIDSIFRNFYVPPVIFAVTYSQDGTEKRVCIDGKQRLTSIWKFMQGTIPFKDSATGDKFYYRENTDKLDKGKQRMLPEKYKKVFRTKQVVCVEYNQLSPDSEREIFQRVQLGMALTPAERLQAIYGPLSLFIRDLLEEFIHGKLELHLDWETSRATDFRCVTTALYYIEKATAKCPSVDMLLKYLEDKRTLDEVFKDGVRSTFKIIVALAALPEYSACFKMDDPKAAARRGGRKTLKVSPAEFVCSVLMIHQHKRKFSMAQLSEAILKMRLDIRRKEQDIRTNTRCMSLMAAFIKDIKPSQLKTKGGKNAASHGVELYEQTSGDDERMEIDSVAPVPTPTAKGRAKKRTRGGSDDDSDYTESKKPASSSSRPASRVKKVKSPTPPPPFNLKPYNAPQSAAPPPTPYTPPVHAVPPPPLPIPSQSAPPVSASASQPPAGPRVHPDRLAAIRNLRAQEYPGTGGAAGWNPPKGPRLDVPSVPSAPSSYSSSSQWDSSSSSRGQSSASSFSAQPSVSGLPPRPAAPLGSYQPASFAIETNLMSKFVTGSHPSLYGPSRGGGGGGSGGDPAYSPGRSNAPPPPYARRDSYPNSSTVGAAWNGQRR